MQIRWPLVFWLFRPLRGLTAVMSVIATLYVLTNNQPLGFLGDSMAILFVLLHVFGITRLLGRVRSSQWAFLYTQGFSRDVLWWHCYLAEFLSVLATWVPCALLILTPLRGAIQSALQNPWFPLMAQTEWPFLTWSLLLYALVLPVFQYEWIRSAAPYRDLITGHLLAIAFLTFAMLTSQPSYRNQLDSTNPWAWSCLAVFGTFSLVLTVTGHWLHRRVEVRS